MEARKKRFRTGCATCRRRKIKCDEGRPECERCRTANVFCDGYESRRHVGPQSQARTGASSSHTSTTLGGAPHSRLPSQLPLFSYRFDGLPLVGCPQNPSCETRPHQKAREILARQQYAFRTVLLLFKEDHLYFWRDHVLDATWGHEYVHEAITALGTMHRAALFLQQPNDEDQLKGEDAKVVALQSYASTLYYVSEQSKNLAGPSDTLIAVHLLLVYFECFLNNAAAAFRHLRVAIEYFTVAESALLEQSSPALEPLRSCIVQLQFVAQIVIPLSGSPFPGKLASTYNDQRSAVHSIAGKKQQLLNIVSSYGEISQSIWAPFGGPLKEPSVETVTALQTELVQWRATSKVVFQDNDNMIFDAPAVDRAYLDSLSIPPQPLNFSSADAAISIALYHCYMAHIIWFLSASTDSSGANELMAYSYVYQNLRIVEGIYLDKQNKKLNENCYFSCEALNVAFSPILFSSAQYSYNLFWHGWAIDRLRFFGQEGLFNGEAFATCLDAMTPYVMTTYQRAWESVASDIPNSTSLSRSHHRPPSAKITPVLYTHPGGQEFAAYYILHSREKYGMNSQRTTKEVGRASWTSDLTLNSKHISITWYNQSSRRLGNSSGECLEAYPPSSEPIAVAWEQILTKPTFDLNATLSDHVKNLAGMSTVEKKDSVCLQTMET